MQSSILLLLYTLSAWGAGLNAPAWARLLWQRWRDPVAGRRWNDTILATRFGLTILSTGIVGLAGNRVWGAVVEGQPITVPNGWGVLFIAMMAAAEPFFLRVDEVHARAKGRRSFGWRLYWAGAIAAVVGFFILMGANR